MKLDAALVVAIVVVVSRQRMELKSSWKSAIPRQSFHHVQCLIKYSKVMAYDFLIDLTVLLPKNTAMCRTCRP